MNQTTINYYFTHPDPDYTIKGSRDPLGFQVIWQHQAKKLIPFLSTVSGNLRDFQVLSLAHFLYGNVDSAFMPFFIRFEQLMAYARFQNGETQFNGTRKVAAVLNSGSSTINLSTNNKDQILTNQRAYGIWGKYNRPFTEIRVLMQPDFRPIYESKIESLPNNSNFGRLMDKIRNKESIRLPIEELEAVNQVFEYTKEEIDFYRRNLLLVREPLRLQNKLHQFFQANDTLGDFYPRLHAIRNYFPEDEELKNVIKEIEATEKILSPLSRIFRHIQSKPIWTKAEISDDQYIIQCRLEENFIFPLTSEHSKTKQELSLLFRQSNWDLILGLVERNRKVTNERGGAAWVSNRSEIVEVHYSDGAETNADYDPNVHIDNDYFFGTYTSLFNQIFR
jgi:hypothetical protein